METCHLRVYLMTLVAGSRYCIICCTYGHRMNDCPNERVKAVRQGRSPEGIKNREIRIIDSEKSIKF
jgi:hypothetical protein